ncbi:MAG: hypothetical protein RL205_1554 [Actinomycetota bacterium]
MRHLLTIGCSLGEGPSWDATTSTWLFVDITQALVHRLDPVSGELTSFTPGMECSAVVPTACGRLLLVGFDRLLLCDASGANIHDFGAPFETDPLIRMNDAKVDSRGRLWAGSRDKERAGRARLFRIDAEGTSTVMREGVNVSNGIGWSPDDATMYYIDSLTYSLRAFDFDPVAGELGASRELCSFDPSTGLPDGLSVDEAGIIWVAHFGSGTITGHTPAGEQVGVHQLPVPNVTSLAFGGAEGTEVLVTTARYRMAEAEIAGSPRSGDLFIDDWGVRGVPTHPFIVG